MPYASHAAATIMTPNQGATPANALRPPPRPTRGHGSLAVPILQPNAAPERPRRNSTVTAMTIASDTTHVISAGVLLRWNPLTKPHQPKSTAVHTTYAMRRVRTSPVYRGRRSTEEPECSRSAAMISEFVLQPMCRMRNFPKEPA
jgi:hypothetical protein